jgi:phage tail sheath gpL-like
MTIDASAVARVLGIDVQYLDLREGGVLFLPQRIAVIAQGSSDVVFSTAKFQATSAGQVGSKLGYGSPAHLIARMLFPSNGDGVGTVPVTFYPMADHASGVAASGNITPSGSQTKAATYRVLVNNIKSEAFVIPVAASVTTICRLIGEAVAAVLEMPVKRTYTYGTVTSAPKSGGNTGNGTCTALSAVGVAKPGAHRLICTSAVANGGVWSLTDPDGIVVATGLTMTPGAGGATVLTGGGLQFTLTDASTDFIVGDEFVITAPATNVVLTSKWKGVSANDIKVEMSGEDLGTTFAITQPTGGLTNPSVVAPLALLGNVWETLLINALNVSDTTALDAIRSVGDGRWGELVRKPFISFVGNTAASVLDATAVSSVRRTEYINAQLVSPGSKDLPFMVAARQVARIARVANNNPPTGYAMEEATGLTPGADEVQWDYLARDQAVKAGSSTVEVIDGVVNLCDTVTFYRPTGEEPPAYRKVVHIIRLMNILFNLDLIFAKKEWASAPLIPDDQATVNPKARKPKSAVAAVCKMHDSLGLNAIISDPAYAKANTKANIDSQNSDRLNLETTVKLSGNSDIVSATLKFGFFFGAQEAA